MTTRGKKNERGASAVEYGLIVALIAAACLLILPAIGVVISTYVDQCAVGPIASGSAPAACG